MKGLFEAPESFLCTSKLSMFYSLKASEISCPVSCWSINPAAAATFYSRASFLVCDGYCCCCYWVRLVNDVRLRWWRLCCWLPFNSDEPPRCVERFSSKDSRFSFISWYGECYLDAVLAGGGTCRIDSMSFGERDVFVREASDK